jgi:prepilin-type processing-associated H-X9-DG protein
MRLPIHGTHRRGSLRAATWIGVLVVVLVLLFLVGLLAPTTHNRNPRLENRIRCANKLKNLGLALQLFATDNEGQFPWRVSIEKGGSLEELADDSRIWRHFQVMSNELSTPLILQCRSDTNIPGNGDLRWMYGAPPTNDSKLRQFSHNDHVSYFLATGFPEKDANRILAGDRNLTRNGVSVRGRIQTATHDRFGFTKPGHHEGGGNLLFTDGSVQQVSSSKAARVFTAGLAPIGTNPPPVLLIP